MKLGAEDFLGVWAIHRQITDMRAMETGVLAGEARFTRAGDWLDYSEAGTLRFGEGRPIPAEQRYRWRFGDDRVAVHFADGRHFHDFALVGAPEASDHLCGDDLYKGSYLFLRWPEWKVVWNVEGPRKRYRSETVFTQA